jgi:AcrR family transcriptional regulator
VKPERAERAPKRPYHHGALRNALLKVGEELVEEKGIEGFTLRECARRAGVSHAAPAHHFGDGKGLVTELAALGFEELDALMTRYRGKEPSDPYSQFVATGLAYVDYALRHRARFQLMFRSDRLDFGNPRLAGAGSRAYRRLSEALAALAPDLRPPALSLDERAALAWSMVHGFAALALENERFAKRVGRSRARARAMLRRILDSSRSVFEGG